MPFQSLAARLALAAFLLALLIAAAAVALVRLHVTDFTNGLTLMAGSVALGLIALMLSLVWLANAFRHNQGDGKRAGMIALVGSLFLLWPPFHTVYEDLISPAIHDATTSPEDPPQFVALANRAPGMNSAAYNGNEQITFHGDTNTADFMLHTYYATAHQSLCPAASPQRPNCSGTPSIPPRKWAGAWWITARRTAASRPRTHPSGSHRTPTS